MNGMPYDFSVGKQLSAFFWSHPLSPFSDPGLKVSSNNHFKPNKTIFLILCLCQMGSPQLWPRTRYLVLLSAPGPPQLIWSSRMSARLPTESSNVKYLQVHQGIQILQYIYYLFLKCNDAYVNHPPNYCIYSIHFICNRFQTDVSVSIIQTVGK